jgi:hypothetical protein
MNDLHELLRTAAGDDQVSFSGADIAERVRARGRVRRRRRVGVAAVGAVVVVAGLLVLGPIGRSSDDLQVASGGISGGAEELVGRWVLTAFSLVSSGGDEPTWLELEASGRLVGAVECTRFEGRWDLVGDRLVVDELEHGDAVGSACTRAGADATQTEALLELLDDHPYVVQPRFSTGSGLVLSDRESADLDAGTDGTWFAFSRFEDLGPMPTVEQVQGEWMHGDGILTFDAEGQVRLDVCPDDRWVYQGGTIGVGFGDDLDCRALDSGLAAVLHAGPEVRLGGDLSNVLYLASGSRVTSVMRFEVGDPADLPPGLVEGDDAGSATGGGPNGP